MNKKFTYKAVLYSYNEDDRVYSSFSEKKDYDNLLKIEKTFMDEVGLKKNCFELASDLFKKRGHELDKYLKHWFGMFTKKEKKDWVDNNTDLLEILEAKENEDKYKELG